MAIQGGQRMVKNEDRMGVSSQGETMGAIFRVADFFSG